MNLTAINHPKIKQNHPNPIQTIGIGPEELTLVNPNGHLAVFLKNFRLTIFLGFMNNVMMVILSPWPDKRFQGGFYSFSFGDHYNLVEEIRLFYDHYHENHESQMMQITTA